MSAYGPCPQESAEELTRGTNLRLTPKAILNPVPVRATALLPTSILLRVTFGGRTYYPSALFRNAGQDIAYESDSKDYT
jgi:hypothetical protein